MFLWGGSDPRVAWGLVFRMEEVTVHREEPGSGGRHPAFPCLRLSRCHLQKAAGGWGLGWWVHRLMSTDTSAWEQGQ